MRVWAVHFNSDGTRSWKATNGNDAYLTWLQNELRGVVGESPFYADRGAITTDTTFQSFVPDFFVNLTVQRFRNYFTSLRVKNIGDTTNPQYQINAVPLNQDTTASPYEAQNWTLVE